MQNLNKNESDKIQGQKKERKKAEFRKLRKALSLRGNEQAK